jgi:type IV pilus assembly protein PilA
MMKKIQHTIQKTAPRVSLRRRESLGGRQSLRGRACAPGTTGLLRRKKIPKKEETPTLPSGSTLEKQGGFSLIELMIVIAIISVVTTFAIPAYQNYVVSANSTKLNVHYRQGVNWVRTEMARLQTQIAGGADLATLEETRNEVAEWVDALLQDVAGSETASPLGGPAFAVAAQDAPPGAVTLALQGSISDGSLQLTIVRPIFGDWENADTTRLCWGGVDCVVSAP